MHHKQIFKWVHTIHFSINSLFHLIYLAIFPCSYTINVFLNFKQPCRFLYGWTMCYLTNPLPISIQVFFYIFLPCNFYASVVLKHCHFLFHLSSGLEDFSMAMNSSLINTWICQVSILVDSILVRTDSILSNRNPTQVT